MLHYGWVHDVRGFAKRPVAASCRSSERHPDLFDVSVRTTASVAYCHGLYIDYDGGSLFMPLGIALTSKPVLPAALQSGPVP
jgi:hypothetical protein